MGQSQNRLSTINRVHYTFVYRYNLLYYNMVHAQAHCTLHSSEDAERKKKKIKISQEKRERRKSRSIISVNTWSYEYTLPLPSIPLDFSRCVRRSSLDLVQKLQHLLFYTYTSYRHTRASILIMYVWKNQANYRALTDASGELFSLMLTTCVSI